VLLLDEPFAALDPRGRTRVRRELRSLVHEQGVTVLQVTHDLAEAEAEADVAILLDGGRVAQAGTPADLFRQPASSAVADYLGS
jgi:ABC-type sulfate/molybdate transport systems ATPase subunit